MSQDLYIEYYKFGITGGRKLYGILFDAAGNALRLVTGAWALDEYVKADHADFAIVMETSVQRTGNWNRRLAANIITLPFNQDGDRYTVEIWEEASVGVRDRDADTFVSAYTFTLTELVASRYEGQMQVAYDHSNSRFSLFAWVDLDGELQDDIVSFSVVVKDSSDDTIVTLSSSSPDADGVFYMSEVDVVLSPDEVYKTIMTFVDANSESHKQCTAGTVWD